MELRDYQSLTLDNIRFEMRRGYKAILVCAPTGAGKTVMFTEIVRAAAAKGSKVVILVDRLNLIQQTSDVLQFYGLSHSIMQGDNPNYRWFENVQLCSVQTVARRGLPEGTDLVIVDECHTLHTPTKKLLLEQKIPVIGFTATPFTKGLGKYYQTAISVTTTHKLIKEKFLSPYRIFACVEPNMDGVRVIAGEWEVEESSKRALQIVGDVVDEYKKHGEDRKFICSAVDIAHARELEHQFKQAGIYAVSYTSDMSEDECSDIVAEFKKQDTYIRGLITVTKATKGFDVPDVGCVIIVRPLRSSLSEHLQLLGRGLRICDGKVDCIILDHAGNCKRFWNVMQAFFETGEFVLDDGEKKEKPKKQAEEKEPMACPSCKRLHNPSPVCPACGFEYPKKSNKVEHKAGTLVELIANEAAEGKCASLWQQLCSYSAARKSNDDEALKRARGLYKSITKNWPPFNWGFERCDVEIMPAVAKQIQRADIAYFHATKRRAA